jgi:hypothetical protein
MGMDTVEATETIESASSRSLGPEQGLGDIQAL